MQMHHVGSSALQLQYSRAAAAVQHSTVPSTWHVQLPQGLLCSAGPAVSNTHIHKPLRQPTGLTHSLTQCTPGVLAMHRSGTICTSLVQAAAVAVQNPCSILVAQATGTVQPIVSFGAAAGVTIPCEPVVISRAVCHNLGQP